MSGNPGAGSEYHQDLMISFFASILNFFRAVWRGFRDPEFQALLTLTIITLLSGMFFYSYAEGWSLLDSLYFSVITLTTVGYGDLSPTTSLSKGFTIVYLLIGVGIIVSFINKIASDRLARRMGEEKKKAEAAERENAND